MRKDLAAGGFEDLVEISGDLDGQLAARSRASLVQTSSGGQPEVLPGFASTVS